MVDKRGFILGDNSIQLFDNNYCYFCGFYKTDGHHIIRKADGGTDDENNILDVCKSCHRLIHSKKFIVQYSKGYFLLINAENPEIVIYPNMRQLNKLRECPFNSINQGVALGKLKIKE